MVRSRSLSPHPFVPFWGLLTYPVRNYLRIHPRPASVLSSLASNLSLFPSAPARLSRGSLQTESPDRCMRFLASPYAGKTLSFQSAHRSRYSSYPALSDSKLKRHSPPERRFLSHLSSRVFFRYYEVLFLSSGSMWRHFGVDCNMTFFLQ